MGMRDQARMSIVDMRAIRAAQSSCNFTIATVSDKRKNPEAIGELGSLTEFQQDNVLTWLESGLSQLERGDTSASAEPVLIDVELVKLYLDFVGLSIASTVVVRAHHNHSSRTKRTDLVRGTNFVGNWASGAGELQTAMDMALSDAVMQLSKTAGHCS
ncbi:hypothetical protein GYB61_03690 [bacterium]|nr:hypothetical protein [bacterium]